MVGSSPPPEASEGASEGQRQDEDVVADVLIGMNARRRTYDEIAPTAGITLSFCVNSKN